MKPITRRDFMKAGAAGIAVAGLPAVFSACAGKSPGVPDGPAFYFKMFGIDEAGLRNVLAEALSRGGDYADLFFEFVTSNSIYMEDDIVSRASTGAALGMGVRVVKGDQTGYSFTEDLTPENLKKVARTASAIASGPGKMPPVNFDVFEHKTFYPVKVRWDDVSVKKRISMMERVNAVMRDTDARVVNTTLSLNDTERYLLVAGSDGTLAVDYQPLTRFNAGCTAESGDLRESNGFNLSQRRDVNWFTKARLNYLGTEAVKRTVSLFDAVPAPAGEMPVVLAAGSAGILLHEAIGHGMEADFNRKGISIFSDKLNKKVAESFVNIVDDGTNPNIRGSINVDDEGTPGQKTYLVRDGILTSYMHDRISAKHYKLKPTGNGRRECFKFPPMPRMRNTYMTDGPHTFDDIIHSTKHGVYADQFTNGEVNIGAGDFTFYVKSGYLIENGRLTRPVKDINIIGNGPDVLTKITMAANDMKLSEGGWTCGKNGQSVPVSQGIPTCKVSSITVGGKNS